MKQRTGDVLRSADRLLRVLEWFSEDRPSGTVADIARDLAVAPATVRRLLGLLEAHRFVQRDPNQAVYRVGFAPLRLAAVVRGTSPVVRAAQPELNHLQESIGELVLLGVLDGSDVVHVDIRESTFPVRVYRPIGRRVRADAGGALGSVLLAWLPESRIRALLDPAFDNKKVAAVLRALGKVRRDGYAVNPGTAFHETVWAFGAPIRDASGAVVAGICVAVPSVRAGKAAQPTVIEAVLASGAAISASLGWLQGADVV